MGGVPVIHRTRESLGHWYVESFNGKLRDELLNGEVSSTRQEAHIIIERWRRQDNTCRPHRALGYRPPAPEARQFIAQQVA